MPFKYKSKEEFVSLDDEKKIYCLARLYIRQDTKPSQYIPYKARLFSCIGYLRKQPHQVLSLLYNYLTDNTHAGLSIWNITPKAVLYDQERRRTENKVDVKQYKEFSEDMLSDILKEE